MTTGTTTAIRPRTAGDLPACVRALWEVHRRDRYPVAWPADPAGWLTPDGATAVWVATVDGVVAGHAGLRVRGAAEAEVVRLFVAPTGRGRGLGARLLRVAGEHAATLGRAPVLEVAEFGDTAAVALYERNGWVRTGARIADWTTPDGAAVVLHDYRGPGSIADR